MNARGGFFGHALDGVAVAGIPARLCFQLLLDGGIKNFFFFVASGFKESHVASFSAHTKVNEHSGVAAIIQNHVGCAAVGPIKNAVCVVPVIDQALTFDGENRGAGCGNRRCSVILGGVNIARRPANIGAQRLQCFDQYAGLNGHVQGTGNAGTFQNLLRAIFSAGGHQPRHFGFGDLQFFAAPIGQFYIGNSVIMLAHGTPVSGEKFWNLF